MATDSYNSFQIADALARQGMAPDRAQALAYQIGDKRLSRDETVQLYDALGMKGAALPEGKDGRKDNTMMEDTFAAGGLAGGIAGLSAMSKPGAPSWMNKIAGHGLGKLAIPGAGAMAALALNPFDESNFYERASTPELLANLAGGMGGAYLGEAVGRNAGKTWGANIDEKLNLVDPTKGAYAKIRNENALKAAAKAAESAKATGNLGTMAKTALSNAPKVSAAKLAGSAVGRGLGTAVGSLGGPIGGIALGTLGGYLLPKLFPGKSPTVAQDDGEERSDLATAGLTAAGATALGLAASPLLRGKAIAGINKVANSSAAKSAKGFVDDAGQLIVANTPDKVKGWGKAATGTIQPHLDKAGELAAKVKAPFVEAHKAGTDVYAEYLAEKANLAPRFGATIDRGINELPAAWAGVKGSANKLLNVQDFPEEVLEAAAAAQAAKATKANPYGATRKRTKGNEIGKDPLTPEQRKKLRDSYAH